MKNTLKGINIRLNDTEEQISNQSNVNHPIRTANRKINQKVTKKSHEHTRKQEQKETENYKNNWKIIKY